MNYISISIDCKRERENVHWHASFPVSFPSFLIDTVSETCGPGRFSSYAQAHRDPQALAQGHTLAVAELEPEPTFPTPQSP